MQGWVALLREQLEPTAALIQTPNQRGQLSLKLGIGTYEIICVIPGRRGMAAPKLARPWAESDLTSVLEVISAAKLKGSANATRDYVMVRSSYLLGCRMSELCRLRWEDIEPPVRGATFGC